MSLTAIIILILIGIFLLIVEFLIVPGVTIAGIGGFLLLIAGIYFSYKFQGNKVGNYTLLVSVIVSIVALIYSLRLKTWKNVGLESNSDSHVESYDVSKINIGDTGKTITRLAPIGKAIVNNTICEAKSTANFIDENTVITVVKLNNNQIIVKPKNI